MGPLNWVELTGAVESVLTSLAIIVGGLWTYFKFFRGRTFHERLEVAVNASRRTNSQISFVEVTMNVANVGLSKVLLMQEGSGLRILGPEHWPDSGIDEPMIAEWKWIATVPIVEDHTWIEPGETIRDTVVIRLPRDNEGPIRIQVVLASEKYTWTSGTISTGADERE